MTIDGTEIKKNMKKDNYKYFNILKYILIP